MMHEYQIARKYMCSKEKLAVFLASPADFRYDEMKRDKKILEGLDWKTYWIEFEGGHRIAPLETYYEAAEWIDKQFK